MTGHQQPAMHPPHQDAYLGSVLLVEDGTSTSDTNFGEVMQEDDDAMRNIDPNRITGSLPERFEPEPQICNCLLYTSPSPRDPKSSRMPSSA